jgi:hypothetical protein
MTDFYSLWESMALSCEELAKAHSYTVGDDETTPTFPRIEKFQEAEPIRNKNFSGPLDNRTHDAGTPDKWKEWNRVHRRALLGGKRVARTGRGYTVFPACPMVNAAILEIAQRYIPFRFDERGLPPEEVRDLCAYLYDCVETLADGRFSTVFLAVEGAKYLRKRGTPIAISDRKFENVTNKRTDK